MLSGTIAAGGGVVIQTGFGRADPSARRV